MCSEIDQFSSFLKRKMSGSTNSPRNSPVEDLAENIDSRPESIINSESERGNNRANRADDHRHQEEFTEEIKNNREELESDSKATAGRRELSDKQIIAEDDGGFKTPTSSGHRIPPITQCPPAPRKQSRPRLKRKPSPDARRSLQFEASSAEVESIFRPICNPDDVEEKKKTKRACREDED